MDKQSLKGLFARYLVIAILMALPYLLVLIDLYFTHNGVNKASFTAISHTFLLLIILWLINLLNQQNPQYRHGIYLIFGLFLCMLIRENREFIGFISHHHLHWSWLAWPVALVFSYLGFRKPMRALNDLCQLARYPDYNFFIVGLLVVLVWSRLIGNRFVWFAAAGDHYLPVIKNAVEEPNQSLGYVLCLSGLLFMTHPFFKKNNSK